MPVWVAGGAVLIGLAAMAVNMGLPDRLDLHAPVLNFQALWLALTGIVMLTDVRRDRLTAPGTAPPRS